MAPAPRDGLTPQQAEAYRALSHSLAGFMNARAKDIELDLQLAGTIEDLLLHARAFEDSDWQQGRLAFESEFSRATVPQETRTSVFLDSDAAWRARWAAGEQESGQPDLDNLIHQYDIRVERHGFSGSFYELVVPREVNGHALENLIAEVPGIGGLVPGWDTYAWGNSMWVGYGGAVRPETRRGGWWLRISVGWGDCLAGCIYGRSYCFDIDTDGTTRLVSAVGSPISERYD